METQHEQVCPFAITDGAVVEPMSAPARPGTVPKAAPPAAQTSVWTHGGQQSGSVFVVPEDRMQNFHRKYNKALMECMAIDKEKARLATENEQLQDLISQFINGTRISDDILGSDNPLFVVNGR
jgi:hypothetical protein